MLADLAARAGFRLVSFDILGSTNEEALRRGRSGDPGDLWIVAQTQSLGRGRLGRTWISPRGNLYATLLLVDPAPARSSPELGFVAGLALARAVADLAPGDGRVFVKWPNDLVHDGAKLAGVLVEGTRTPDGRFVAALGFGVNCAAAPEGLPYRTTRLQSFAGPDASPQALLPRLCARVAESLALWDRGRNFAAVREAWIEVALPAGVPLEVRIGADRVQGRFETIDEHGRLLLATEGGVLAVDAADVFLKDQDPSIDREKR